MADDTYTSNRRLNTGASEFNAISFLVESMIKGMVNTCIPVRVDSVTVNSEVGSMQPAGYVSATPLIQQRGADGKSLMPVSIPQLPYFRYRAGKAAVVMDPQPGDVGIAVFAQQDISNLQQEGTDPVPAGSFRAFDESDAIFLPSILGPAPETWVFLDPTGRKIEINGPMEVIVRSETKVTIQSDTQIDMQAPKINLRGSVTMGNTAGDAGSDTMTFIGNLNMDGALTTSGNIRSEGSITAPHIHED